METGALVDMEEQDFEDWDEGIDDQRIRNMVDREFRKTSREEPKKLKLDPKKPAKFKKNRRPRGLDGAFGAAF
jgi:hypothetical protein